MDKKLITKKTLLKKANIGFRLTVGLIFVIASLCVSVTGLLQYFTSDIISVENTIGNMCINLFILIIFGGFIGAKQIIDAASIIKYINSKKFIIETDILIDKIDTGSTKCHVLFEYNDIFVSHNDLKELRKNSKYYIFNLPKNETLALSINQYKLDEFLKMKIVSYHVNNKNTIENYE